jgi:hypothetical protein
MLYNIGYVIIAWMNEQSAYVYCLPICQSIQLWKVGINGLRYRVIEENSMVPFQVSPVTYVKMTSSFTARIQMATFIVPCSLFSFSMTYLRGHVFSKLTKNG